MRISPAIDNNFCTIIKQFDEKTNETKSHILVLERMCVELSVNYINMYTPKDISKAKFDSHIAVFEIHKLFIIFI